MHGHVHIMHFIIINYFHIYTSVYTIDTLSVLNCKLF